MEKLSVAIVDDNPLILNTLDEMINGEEGLSVIGKADNGEDAVDMIEDTTPDIVLLDLIMPKMDGISVVEKAVSYTHLDVYKRQGRSTTEATAIPV